MTKQRLDEFIDANKALFTDMSDKIWEYAEIRFLEHRSAALLSQALEQEGFAVRRGIAGLDTAFMASFGTGKPVVAFLGEYDALAGLSQIGGVAEKRPVQGCNSNGHGCGHNLLGVGALAAAVAVKRYMEETGLSGTVRYYGCPGEEGGSGKAFMARGGAFDDVDAALTWHPFGHTGIWSLGTLANYQVSFRFHGRSSHAASAPHLGRSALDAVELMNVGVNYLREHIQSDARVHYAITNTGGHAPNVVQAEAEVLYLMRAPQLSQVQEIYERIVNIAKGAALMTETTCEIIFDKACSNCIPNKTLETVMFNNLLEVGPPQFNDADRDLASHISSTLSPNDIDSDLAMGSTFTGGRHPEVIAGLRGKELSDTILPYVHAAAVLPGSTDVGDVSWITPTAQVITACQALGTPGHSWQAVSQGTTAIAHKGMVTAAKVMARTAVDILHNPAIATQAQAELQEKLGGTAYVSPIPQEVQPKLPL